MSRNSSGGCGPGCGCLIVILILLAAGTVAVRKDIVGEFSRSFTREPRHEEPVEPRSIDSSRAFAEYHDRASGTYSESSVEERGVGSVLLEGRIPRKALAARKGFYIYDDEGLPKQAFRTAVPYFVFDDSEDRLLVGRVQDREVAEGWVLKSESHSWFSRRLVYPRPGSDLAAKVRREVGPEALPPLEPTSRMPWPILHETDEEGEWLVLCDFGALGGEYEPSALPIMGRFQDRFDIYVLFTETELDRTLSDLTGLMAALDSGKMPVEDIPRVFGSFMTQNQVDFLDLDEVKKVLDIYPGTTPSDLLKGKLESRFRAVANSLGPQIDWLLSVSRSREYYNGAHGTYVVPLSSLEWSKAK